MVRWHHRHDWHAFEQALGVDDGQGRPACFSPCVPKESDTAEWLNWTGIISEQRPFFFLFFQSVHILFPFLVISNLLVFLVLYWKGVMRGDILALYLTLVWKIWIHHWYEFKVWIHHRYHVTCRNFCRYYLSIWRCFFLYYYLKSFYHEWVLDFDQICLVSIHLPVWYSFLNCWCDRLHGLKLNNPLMLNNYLIYLDRKWISVLNK